MEEKIRQLENDARVNKEIFIWFDKKVFVVLLKNFQSECDRLRQNEKVLRKKIDDATRIFDSSNFPINVSNLNSMKNDVFQHFCFRSATDGFIDSFDFRKIFTKFSKNSFRHFLFSLDNGSQAEFSRQSLKKNFEFFSRKNFLFRNQNRSFHKFHFNCKTTRKISQNCSIEFESRSNNGIMSDDFLLFLLRKQIVSL